jgi:hypothetical protein
MGQGGNALALKSYGGPVNTPRRKIDKLFLLSPELFALRLWR